MQIEFDTEIDWQERQTLLKTGFPFDLNLSENREEIQFGHVKRSNHKKTSWDQAQFKTSIHYWVVMSHPDFGAALLPDCKYGYDTVEQTVRLTLLKGSNVPDPNADLGLHHFRYALLLHQGEKDISEVERAAKTFNTPVLVHGALENTVMDRLPLDPRVYFAVMDNPDLTLETVKLTKNGNDVIMRIFEHSNRRSAGRLQFAMTVSQMTETDLMEPTSGKSYEIADNGLDLSFRPFEIKTLRVTIDR
jgi:alpha-mannosidase